MHVRFLASALLIAAGISTGITPVIHADEGMWLFNNPPRKLLKEKYNFEPTDQWLEHVQKSSVRFNSGGSGSFVSPNGLVMTNHHVGADCLQKLGDKDHNYYRDGFWAKTRADEKRCHDLELNVLMSIEDVTERVNAAVKRGTPPEEAARARRKVRADIEKESLDKTGLRSDVVTLYHGGQYHLYRYKKYTDVRLVFAPEQQIAFFGGDPDNFEYPRFNLDMCFFRVYENDKPAKPEHYLRWSNAGATNDELVFVSGHPGRTNRQNTVADLEFLRDGDYPHALRRLNGREVMLLSYSGRSDENAREARKLLFSVQNGRKARDAILAGLLDPALMNQKAVAERTFREAVHNDPRLKDAESAWDKISEALKTERENYRQYDVLENAAGLTSRYFEIARTLVQAALEYPKPNGDRLPEYRDSNRESLELELFSDEPIYDNFERAKLGSSLTFLTQQLSYNDKLVRQIMDGKSPDERADELVRDTKLKDVAERKRLYEGGLKAIEESTDAMIRLARLVDPEAREVRKTMETRVEEVKRQAYAQIARAKYALEGASTYPDASGTLRLSLGVVKGYEENGTQIPFETTFAGLYERSAEHHGRPPFDLPPRWVQAKDKLDLSTPLNFVCAADVWGGNSGSPVINKDAEVVGLIFDGNIQSLVFDFIYTEKQARTVAVHSRGIIEALRKVYRNDALADELTGKQ
jgi:hypothetical protein